MARGKSLPIAERKALFDKIVALKSQGYSAESACEKLGIPSHSYYSFRNALTKKDGRPRKNLPELVTLAPKPSTTKTILISFLKNQLRQMGEIIHELERT